MGGNLESLGSVANGRCVERRRARGRPGSLVQQHLFAARRGRRNQAWFAMRRAFSERFWRSVCSFSEKNEPNISAAVRSGMERRFGL